MAVVQEARLRFEDESRRVPRPRSVLRVANSTRQAIRGDAVVQGGTAPLSWVSNRGANLAGDTLADNCMKRRRPGQQ